MLKSHSKDVRGTAPFATSGTLIRQASGAPGCSAHLSVVLEVNIEGAKGTPSTALQGARQSPSHPRPCYPIFQRQKLRQERGGAGARAARVSQGGDAMVLQGQN